MFIHFIINYFLITELKSYFAIGKIKKLIEDRKNNFEKVKVLFGK